MQPSAEGAQTPYEVYCYQCQVTFPVGQRRCLHCGGRLGPRSETPFRAASMSQPAGSRTLPDEEPEEGSLALRRFGGLALWALLVVSALLSNLCGR